MYSRRFVLLWAGRPPLDPLRERTASSAAVKLRTNANHCSCTLPTHISTNKLINHRQLIGNDLGSNREKECPPRLCLTVVWPEKKTRTYVCT